MPLTINTNLPSIIAQQNLNETREDLNTAFERLSSGLRINSAADDAAGLAISTRFTAQIRGLDVAIRNAQDGVSLAQTAEAALGSMTDSLLRIRDLALQASNATNSDTDREALNQEVQQLKKEIERVSEQAQFNETKLLDGSFTDVTFQIGANEGETITFGIEGATIDELGSALTDGISSAQQGGTDPVSGRDNTASAILPGDLTINGIAIDPSNAADDGASFSVDGWSVDASSSAIAKAAAINRSLDETGVRAEVGETRVSGSSSFDAASASGQLTINGETFTFASSAAIEDAVNLENIANVINQRSGVTGVTAEYSGKVSNGIQLLAEDGRNITIEEVGGVAAEDFGLAAATTYAGSFVLISTNNEEIEIDTTTGNIDNAGLAVTTVGGSNSGVVGRPVSGEALETGDLVINGVAIGPTVSADDTSSFSGNASSALAKAAAINKLSEQTGVTATASPTIVTANASTFNTAALTSEQVFTINNVAISVGLTGDPPSVALRDIVDAVNNKAGQTGVTAEAVGTTYRLIAEDGRNITIAPDTGTLADLGLQATTFGGSIVLESAGTIQINSDTGDIGATGFEIGDYGAAETGQLVRDIDVSTFAGAQEAIVAVDNALNSINFQRAQLGAIQNRFDATIENQRIARENLQAANSRIRDADFAEETARLAREQALQQAGISVLAQANAQTQQVLQLLQG